MKIALIDNSKGWGGAEEMLLSLALGLRSRGHRVGLFLRDGSETVGKFAQTGFDVWPIPRQGFGMLAGIATMSGIARREKFDLIHVHRNHDLLVGKIAGFSSGKLPLILTQHCWLGKTSFPLINLPDRIVTVSDFIAGGITGRFPRLASKIRVVHNGISLQDFDQPRADYWNSMPELTGKGPFLGVIGYFYKNQEELIELLPRLKAHFPNVMLIIIGRDEKKRFLLENKAAEMEVRDSVFFAGDIPHKEMKHALAGLDLSVSAYRREGFGLSVVEGMAVGTPFVGFRAGGYREIVEQGRTGYLVENRDEFVDVLLRVLGDKGLLAQLRENGRAAVRRRFSLETMLDRYESLYGELLHK
jgi:glycosyltransferase involved in cell wall biosynthesis